MASGAGVTVPFAKGQKLGGRTPFADLSKFESDPQVVKLGEQLTVGDMVRYVESKIK